MCLSMYGVNVNVRQALEAFTYEIHDDDDDDTIILTTKFRSIPSRS